MSETHKTEARKSTLSMYAAIDAAASAGADMDALAREILRRAEQSLRDCAKHYPGDGDDSLIRALLDRDEDAGRAARAPVEAARLAYRAVFDARGVVGLVDLRGGRCDAACASRIAFESAQAAYWRGAAEHGATKHACGAEHAAAEAERIAIMEIARAAAAACQAAPTV
jgi:hypothetical protein